MEVILDNQQVLLSNILSTKGEGEIYIIDSYSLAKIYHDRPEIRTRVRKEKVIALCNSYYNNLSSFGSNAFAFPKTPAYEGNVGLNYLVGFSMQYFKGGLELSEIAYDIKAKDFKSTGGIKLSDDEAINFIYKVFELTQKLHDAGIILGDVNMGNILLLSSTKLPVLVDIDSAQFGQYKCVALTEEYLDPDVEQQGKNLKGGYTYSTDSDYFALASMLFEFFVGVNPFFLNHDKKGNYGVPENKTEGICYLKALHLNQWQIAGANISSSNPINKKIETRIAELKSKNIKLYEYFVDVLVHRNKISLMQTLDRSDPRHPAFIFYSTSGFNTALDKIIRQRQLAEQRKKMQRSFALPDSGFAKILNLKQKTTLAERIEETKALMADPKELTAFIKNYAPQLEHLIA